MFAAQKAVDFVAQVPKAFSELSRSHFAANVRALRTETFQGNKSATARAILHSRKTIECWCDESQNPMLLSLLMLSFRLGVEPISLLTEDVTDRILVGPNAPGRCCLPVVRRTARRHNRKRLHAALVRILGEREDPPPSMHKIGLRLKRHQSYLARAFPDLVADAAREEWKKTLTELGLHHEEC
jgi:hypothetical protein